MRIMLCAALLLFSMPASAANYYNEKWFDIPDIGTLPRVTTTCAHEACTDIPEVHGWRIEMKRHCVCTNPIVKSEILRRDVRVVVSGPDTLDQAAKNAIIGYVTGCVAAAIAASTAGPQIIVSPAGFYASFKGCLAAVSVSGITGGILNQLDIHLNTDDTHWAPL